MRLDLSFFSRRERSSRSSCTPQSSVRLLPQVERHLIHAQLAPNVCRLVSALILLERRDDLFFRALFLGGCRSSSLPPPRVSTANLSPISPSTENGFWVRLMQAAVLFSALCNNRLCFGVLYFKPLPEPMGTDRRRGHAGMAFRSAELVNGSYNVTIAQGPETKQNRPPSKRSWHLLPESVHPRYGARLNYKSRYRFL
jgi:hypothetical protein